MSAGDGGLRPGRAAVSLLGSHFATEDGTAEAFATPAGRRRVAVLAASDRVGDEPRLLIDFAQGRPLISARGGRVGGCRKGAVLLWGREFRVRRPWPRARLNFEVTEGGRVVLRVREHSSPDVTVRMLRTASDPALDPVVAVALLLVTSRPDRMRVFNELTRHLS